jgi:hypothetical protein
MIVRALLVAALATVGVAAALAGRHNDRDAVWVGLARDAQRGVVRMTEQICRALRDGGRIGIHDVDALRSPAPARLCAAVTALRDATYARATRGRDEAPGGRLAAIHEQRFRDAVAAMHSLDVAVQTAIRDGRRPPVIACAVAAALLLLALVAAIGLGAPPARGSRS